MNREVHVRFWERLEVKLLRATRHSRRFLRVYATSGSPPKLTVKAGGGPTALGHEPKNWDTADRQPAVTPTSYFPTTAL